MKGMKKNKSFREIRYEEKKKSMIVTAAKVFGKKGFHGTSIENIANKMKMTKGSLYYYFSNKDELLYQVHIFSLNEVIESIDKISDSNDSPAIKFKKAITAHLKVLGENYEGSYMLQQEYLLPDNYRNDIVAIRNKYEKKFLHILKEGKKQNVFSVKDYKITLFVILGAINWFLRWYSSDGPLKIEEIADKFARLFLYGLLTRSGVE